MKVLKRLATHGCITPLEALNRYGIFRLASRIHDLKRDGWKIDSQIDTKKNAFGEVVRFARYWLSEKQIRKARNAVGVV